MSIVLLLGCSKEQSTSDKLLDKVERVMEINPDSASTILKSILLPEDLNNENFARWCMLSGKITDKIFDTLLPTEQFEKASSWYLQHGAPIEQVQILIYLGRSNSVDGNYDKSMSIYINALEIAQKNKLNNQIGYIYSYMGDLYEEKSMHIQAIDKYKMAVSYFKKANNTDSYACALRDLGREYACTDSISHSLNILHTADSISANSTNKNIKASICNTLGNIYAIQKNYHEAEKYLLIALTTGKNKMPNYIALTDLYTASGSIDKAKGLLHKIQKNDPTYTYSIKYLHYQIYKSEKNYKEALMNLEEYTNIVDSIINADNQSKILNIETKYNHLKIKQEINTLKIKEQNYINAIVICFSILLSVIIGYILYRKEAKDRIHKQQNELNEIKIKLLNLSLNLEIKRNQINTLKEKDENYHKIEEEIRLLSINYKKLQNKLLSDSSIYKKLSYLANQHIPQNSKPLISKEQWRFITKEITSIYPALYNYIYNLCPNLSEQDFQYCCLYMYGFDTNAEAKLLNISTNSVRTKHLRLRQKLNISLPANTTLYEYLTENIH